MQILHYIWQDTLKILSKHLFSAGTDHQRIAKLDRENEVAPPAKIAPSVGRVRLFSDPASSCLTLEFHLT